MTVVADDDVLGGLPRLGGHPDQRPPRLRLVGGAEPADALDLALARVYEALAYYYDHPDEMRTLREREAAELVDLKRRTVDPPVETRDAP